MQQSHGGGLGFHGHQYAPPVLRRRSNGHAGSGRTTRTCAAGSSGRGVDLLTERARRRRRVPPAHGPFHGVRATASPSATGGSSSAPATGSAIPWFGWLFALPVRALLARRGRPPTRHAIATERTPWWAPPDQIDARQALVLGLLAAASMSSAFTNTLFTQTAQFAADDFGVGDFGFSVAGAVVRAGIVIALPFAFLADRIGRRRVIRIVAWAAPIVTALGALAPTFPVLVATQAVGRPLGLALDFLIAVAVAEEMPRNSRAYAVSVMAMASGLGAGIAVMALPLADLGDVGLAARLPRDVDLAGRRRRHLAAAARDRALRAPARRQPAARPAPLRGAGDGGGLRLNFFVAPASFFQNRYLREVRGFDAGDDRRCSRSPPPRRPRSASSSAAGSPTSAAGAA